MSNTEEDSSKDRLFVAALAKGLTVLQCFSERTPELGSSEIASKTGIPQPTVWRLCHTLLELGFLVPGREKTTMRLGLPILRLGYAVLSTQPIAELAKADMQQLASRYEGAVSLGTRDGLDMIYLQRCQGSSIVFATLKVGSRVPMATSATGWAYIAGLDADGRKNLLHELEVSIGAEWAGISSGIEAALTHYDRNGFIINKGSLHPNINSVAVPLIAPDGSRVLSLSSGGLSQIFNDKVLLRIGEDLKILAAKLAPVLRETTDLN